MQVRKFIPFIGFILIHILVVGCSKCDKKKGNPLARAERTLKNNLKEQCKAEGWKKLEEAFEQDRNNLENINQHIQMLLALQEKINNLEKALLTIASKVASKTLNAQEKQGIQSLIDFVSPLKQFPEELANKKIDELSNNQSALQKFSGLLNTESIPAIKTFLTNQLDLWRNLKQQLLEEAQKSTEPDNES